MSKKNKSTNSTYEIVRKMRGDWGSVNPVTKVIPNKKKNYEYGDEYYDLEHGFYEEEEYEPGRVYWDEMEANP